VTDLPWYRRPRQAAAFLSAQAASAAVAVLHERDADGAPRALLKADAPPGAPIPMSVRLQGPTVRLTAHRVVEGQLSPVALRNFNLVNQAPWAGRAYPSPDGLGTDLSLGAPAPADPGLPFPLVPLLGVLHAGAVQLRLGRAPRYTGPPVPDPAALPVRARAWLERRGMAVELDWDGAVVATGTRTPAGRPVRLELFAVGREVLVARAVPQGVRPLEGSDEVLGALARWNAGAAAGAAAWWPETGLVYGSAAVPPGLIEPDDATLHWLTARAMDAADGAVSATTAAPPAGT
jgi:hypothetical protein